MSSVLNKLRNADKAKFIVNNINIISELLYYLIFAIVFIERFCDTTMLTWRGFITNDYILISLMLGYVILRCSAINIKDKSDIWLSALIITAFMYEHIYSEYKYFEILPFAFLLVGAKNIPFKRIVKTAFFISLILTLVTIVTSLCGITENLIYEQERGFRYSLGFIYPTDFAAHIFFMLLMWLYLRANKFNIADIIICIVSAIFIFVVTKSKCSTVCIILVMLGMIFVKFQKSRYNKNGKEWSFSEFLTNRLALVPIFLTLVMLVLGIAYESQSDWILKINDISNNRVYLTNAALGNYGLHIWQKFIVMIGFGGTSDTTSIEGYNFIDCSYMHILIRYGFIVFLLVSAIFIMCFRKSGRLKDNTTIIILLVISIQCFMEQHLIDISYNVFLFYVFANTEKYNSITQKIFYKLKAKSK